MLTACSEMLHPHLQKWGTSSVSLYRVQRIFSSIFIFISSVFYLFLRKACNQEKAMIYCEQSPRLSGDFQIRGNMDTRNEENRLIPRDADNRFWYKERWLP